MFRSYKDTIRTPVKVSREATKKYLCDLCDSSEVENIWDSESDLEIHRRRAHNIQLIQLMQEPKNYMCCVCLRQQADRAALIAHIKTDHLLSPPDSSRIKREIFICAYCTNVFFNKTLLTAHIKSFHLHSIAEKKIATTLCPVCDKSIKIRTIWFHFFYHGIISTGTCPICLTQFEDYEDVLKHIECHPGSYTCYICSYETNKESLFLSHIEKHKKCVSLENKDLNSILKYFVPEKRVTWNRKVVNIFKGITLTPEIQICILCRTMCVTEEQMLQHIYGDHSPLNKVEITRYMCMCGEEFFNRVLLKHHIFMLKGDHRVYDGKEPLPVKKASPSVKQNNTAVTKQTGKQKDKREEEVFDVVIDDGNISNTAVDCTDAIDKSQEGEEEEEKEKDKEDYSIHYYKHKKISQHKNTEKHTKDKIVDTEIVIDVHTDIDIASQESEEDMVNDESNNDNINEAEIVIQSQNINKNIEDRTEIKSNTAVLESYNVHHDQIIIDGNHYTLELSDGYKKTIDKDRFSIEIITDTDVEHEKLPVRVKKRTHEVQDEVMLKDAPSKKFKSTKQFYEQVLNMNGEIEDTCDSVKSSVGDDSSQEHVQYTIDPSQEVAVYEVIEVIGTANEDTEKTDENSEEPSLFS